MPPRRSGSCVKEIVIQFLLLACSATRDPSSKNYSYNIRHTYLWIHAYENLVLNISDKLGSGGRHCNKNSCLGKTYC